MSAQTGTPPSQRQVGGGPVARLRSIWDRLRHDPNPVWMREMRQSARLTRTPIIMMLVSFIVTLLLASAGGAGAAASSDGSVGSIIFQLYFGFAYFVVVFLGPALAANGVASEREGKTWEALLLTGMDPSEIARGKFLGALTAIGMYLVMLAPSAALAFLFGGVTPFEVVAAFLILFAISIVSVTFGLAISSKVQSLRAALVITLVASVPIGCFMFGFFGYGGAELAHDVWGAVPRKVPIWLPLAYSRATFGWEYIVMLILLPAAFIILPSWLFYEIARSNLTSVTADRSHGVKTWYIVAATVLAISLCIPLAFVPSRDVDDVGAFALMGFATFVLIGAFLHAREAIGPSRRVTRELENASFWRRRLVPTIPNATNIQLMFGIGLFVAMVVVVLTAVEVRHSSSRSERSLLLVGSYAAGFLTFCIGLGAYLRSRATGSMFPRVLLMVAGFVVSVGPWIIAAIVGITGDGRFDDDVFLFAAPSPFYLGFALDKARHSGHIAVTIGYGMGAVYGLAGIFLHLLSSNRVQKIRQAHDKLIDETDQRLAAEDAPPGAPPGAGPTPVGSPDGHAPPEADQPPPQLPHPPDTAQS